jgi:hypothetical protein
VHSIGISNGNNSDGFWLDFAKNSYKSDGAYYYYLPEEEGEFEWPNEVNSEVEYKARGNTTGCGILLDPQNKVAIFFTRNGNLLSKF